MTTKYKSRKIKFKTTFRQKAIIMKTLPRKEKKNVENKAKYHIYSLQITK